MYYLNFRIIKLVVVWMQRFEICDFVCKKVCIKWECASSGDLRYLSEKPGHNVLCSICSTLLTRYVLYSSPSTPKRPPHAGGPNREVGHVLSIASRAS